MAFRMMLLFKNLGQQCLFLKTGFSSLKNRISKTQKNIFTSMTATLKNRIPLPKSLKSSRLVVYLLTGLVFGLGFYGFLIGRIGLHNRLERIILMPRRYLTMVILNY